MQKLTLFFYYGFFITRFIFSCFIFASLNYDTPYRRRSNNNELFKVKHKKKYNRNKKIKSYGIGDNKRQVTFTWGGISGCSVLGNICGIPNDKYSCIPAFFNFNVSYTYWFNNYLGFDCSIAILKNICASMVSSSKAYLPLLEPGIGIRCSYNGRGGSNRSSGICYSGGLMVSVPWIGICDIDREDFIKWDLTAVGVYVGLNPIRIDTLNNLTLGINALCIDIVNLITEGFYYFGITNLFYIRVFIGKSWWI